VLATVAGGALVVGVGVGLLLVGIFNLRSNASTTQRTAVLLDRVIRVERSVVDAETGLRGYVITADLRFLGPLRAARRSLPGERASLVDAATHDRDHVGAARELGAAAHRYMSGYVGHVLTLMRLRPNLARSLAVTLAGKRQVDAIRSRSAALESTLSAQENARARTANATANRDITYGVIVLIVLVLLTALIEGVFGRLVLTRERALARSRANARMLQTSLLPLAIPEIPSCDLAIRFTPAGLGELVGGDFYDVFELDAPNRWAVIVGDVCGKGAEAAATTAVARWTLRSSSLLTATPEDALQHLNEVMRRRRQRFLFATITYLLLEIGPQELRVTIACAGHPPPIVLAGDQPPFAAPAHGDLVGIWPRLRLQTSEARLAPGDLLVAYTDGATDFSAEAIEPLALFLRDADHRDAQAVAEAIEARALSGRVAARDDIAVVAIAFRGAEPAGEERAPSQADARPAGTANA
jgi:serine phosphatase RsbU (regulator of sigma subunit)